MAKTNNLTLPYVFRNIGLQPATLTHLQDAKPIRMRMVECPPKAAVQANFQFPSGLTLQHKGAMSDLPANIKAILDGKDSEFVLWEVVVVNDGVRLHYHHATNVSVKHSVDGSIAINHCGYHLELGFEAATFRKLAPKRNLCCSYDHDARLGDYIRVIEWRECHGVSSLMYYPQAHESGFEAICQGKHGF